MDRCFSVGADSFRSQVQLRDRLTAEVSFRPLFVRSQTAPGEVQGITGMEEFLLPGGPLREHLDLLPAPWHGLGGRPGQGVTSSFQEVVVEFAPRGIAGPDIWLLVATDAQTPLGAAHDPLAIQAGHLARSPEAQGHVLFGWVVGQEGRHGFDSAEI